MIAIRSCSRVVPAEVEDVLLQQGEEALHGGVVAAHPGDVLEALNGQSGLHPGVDQVADDAAGVQFSKYFPFITFISIDLKQIQD